MSDSTKTVLVAGCFALLATLACDRTSTPSPSAAQKPAAVSVSPPEVTPPASASAAPPAPISDSAKQELHDLVDAWVRAKNQGDFAVYSGLYAERFTGVKRSGDYVFRAGRQGWLEDRQKMFTRPMTVTATGVSIVGTPDLARVSFTQEFRTG